MAEDVQVSDLTPLEKDSILYAFWMTQLKHYGVVQGGYSITEKGAAVAKEILATGHHVSDESISDLLFTTTDSDEVSMIDVLAQHGVVCAVRDRGIDTVIAEMRDTLLSPEMEGYRSSPEGIRMSEKLFNPEPINYTGPVA